jgi:4-amino-4-deoxy-L-arabinose transferase-like glycosyltransferase
MLLMASLTPPQQLHCRILNWLRGWPVLLLLGTYAALAITGAWRKSIAYDEMPHVTAGYSYWLTDDFRLHPENGNLPQRWAALPQLWSRPRFPSLNQSAWRTSNPWQMGEQFLYGQGNDADALLLRGRIMITVLGVGLGLLVYCWSRHLFGRAGGLISLAVYAFSPAMLAHGALVTSDLAVAFFFAASVWAIWVVLHSVTPLTLLASSLAVAGLFLCKMSAVLIVPVGLLLLLLRVAFGRPLTLSFGRTRVLSSRWRQLPVLTCLVPWYALVVWAAVWASFGFRYSAFRAEEGRDILFPGGWRLAMKGPASVSGAIEYARDRHLLPEAYLYGMAYINFNSQERRAFFNGECASKGWWLFFPYCLLVKTPLPVFALLMLAGAAGVTAVRSSWRGTQQPGPGLWSSLYNLAPLAVFLIVYWAAAVTSHLNIGDRHLLPTYPFIFVLTGAAALCFHRPAQGTSTADHTAVPSSLLRFVSLALLVALAVEALWTWPHYLSYFNVLAGGPAQAYKHLVDSSLDWGQDLRGLSDWLNERGLPTADQPVYLSYFGSGSPEYYGIRASLLPCVFARGKPGLPQPLRGGVFCISATMLQAVYLPTPGPWTHSHEILYQKLRAAVPRIHKDMANRDTRGESAHAADEQNAAQVFRVFDEVRLARLCASLRKRDPDAEVGYSILVYYLSDADVERALTGPPP